MKPGITYYLRYHFVTENEPRIGVKFAVMLDESCSLRNTLYHVNEPDMSIV